MVEQITECRWFQVQHDLGAHVNADGRKEAWDVIQTLHTDIQEVTVVWTEKGICDGRECYRTRRVHLVRTAAGWTKESSNHTKWQFVEAYNAFDPRYR